jgi:hypothetical protein
MSPGLGRTWARFAIVGPSAIVMLPLLNALSRSLILTWFGIVALGVATVLLFRWRRKLRASFFLPLAYLAGLSAFRLRFESGIDSIGFTVAICAFLLLCVTGLVVDAFWSPYEDDLAEMKYLANFKE